MIACSIRRVVLIALVVSVWATPRAEGSPLLVTFEGEFALGPLAGTAFTASYFFDALPPASPNVFPCCADGSWPVSLLLLNVGGHQLLTQPNPGFNFLTHGGVGIFGPFWNVPTAVLPAGLLSWGFSGDPFHFYGFAGPNCFPGGTTESGDCFTIESFTDITVTSLSPRTIPEPPALILSALGVLFLGLAHARNAAKRIVRAGFIPALKRQRHRATVANVVDRAGPSGWIGF